MMHSTSQMTCADYIISGWEAKRLYAVVAKYPVTHFDEHRRSSWVLAHKMQARKAACMVLSSVDERRAHAYCQHCLPYADL